MKKTKNKSISISSKSNPYLAVQSNDLVNASYRVTLAEKRLLLMMIAQIERDDEDFQEYSITVSDFKNFIDRKNPYKQMSDITDKILGRVLHIPLENGEWFKTNFISSARYAPKTGTLYLDFHPKLKPYLLGIKNRFTQLDIRHAIGLKSTYAIRIYELLKQWHTQDNGCYRVIVIDNLRHLLQLDDKYLAYKDFKVNVILRAQKELREKADIYFSFEEIKEGRKVARLKFSIYKNEEVLNSKQLDLFFDDELQNWQHNLGDERLEFYHNLCKFGLSHDKALKYAQEKSCDVLKSALEITKKKADSSDGFTHSAGQFLSSLIEKDIVAGKSDYERQKEEAAQTAKLEAERVLKSRIEGNKLYREYQEERTKMTNEIVSKATVEEIQEIKNSISETELGFMMKNGKIDISSPMFKVNFLRYKKLLSNEEDCIKWALDKHQIKLKKYKLSASEEITYRNKIEVEGWEIVQK